MTRTWSCDRNMSIDWQTCWKLSWRMAIKSWRRMRHTLLKMPQNHGGAVPWECADVNRRYDSFYFGTPLGIAAYEGNVAIVQALLEHNAKADVIFQNARSILHGLTDAKTSLVLLDHLSSMEGIDLWAVE